MYEENSSHELMAVQKLVGLKSYHVLLKQPAAKVFVFKQKVCCTQIHDKLNYEALCNKLNLQVGTNYTFSEDHVTSVKDLS